MFDTSFYVIASDKASGKTEGKFIAYRDSDGESFKVYVIGADRAFDIGVTARASYGFAENIMQQGYLNLVFTKTLESDLTIQIDAHQYIGDAVGDGALAGIGAEYASAVTNLVAALSYKSITVTASYQTVKGDTYEASWDGDHDETGLVTTNALHRLDFNRRDEDSIQLRVDYDFKDIVEGLTLMARYAHGSDIRRTDGRDGREWVRDVELNYAVPMLEGLSFRWRNSSVRSSETFGTDENRVIVNYSHKLF